MSLAGKLVLPVGLLAVPLSEIPIDDATHRHGQKGDAQDANEDEERVRHFDANPWRRKN
jgi:hypothetical protein